MLRDITIIPYILYPFYMDCCNFLSEFSSLLLSFAFFGSRSKDEETRKWRDFAIETSFASWKQKLSAQISQLDGINCTSSEGTSC